VPFVVIQIMMIATVIAFPGIVTSHVSKAPGAISGSGADELRRQLNLPAQPAPSTPADKGAKPGTAPKPGNDPGAEIERMLKQDRNY
jgi:hypothetical protein